MGGTAALAAGALAHASAVASLSGPASFGGADARAGIRKLHVPSCSSWERGDTEFVGDARQLYAASSHATTQLSIQDDAGHGTALLARAPARALLLTFLTKR